MLKPGIVYSGDNGRLFCREHAGNTATYTGYDLDGTKCEPVDDALRAEFAEHGLGEPVCESCHAHEAHERAGLKP